MSIPFELVVKEQDFGRLQVRWCDNKPDNIFLANIPDSWLDLVPFMVARKIVGSLEQPRAPVDRQIAWRRFRFDARPTRYCWRPPLLNTDNPVGKAMHRFADDCHETRSVQ
jgi:hypothetical protein